MDCPEKSEQAALVAGLALLGLFTTSAMSLVLSVVAFSGSAALVSVSSRVIRIPA